MARTDQLPGITFQIEPPQPPEALPRMDIAAFVGFAAAGPLHTPVPVEDVARFRDIFGPDLPLVRASRREPESAAGASSASPPAASPAAPAQGPGRMRYAHLGPAVEAFFRNGGRRCWVVRVAAETAAANRFLLPGLVEAGSWQPALAPARCAGDWSDRLRVGTVRQGQALGLATQPGSDAPDFTGAPGAYRLGLKAAPDQLQPGDLLQLSFEPAGPLCFLSVSQVIPASDRQVVVAHRAFWFRRYTGAALSSAGATVTLLTGRPEPARPATRLHLAAGPQEMYTVQFEQTAGQRPWPGGLLRLDFRSGETLLLAIAGLVEGDGSESPPGQTWTVRARIGLWPVTEAEGLSRAAGLTPAIERLAFELLVWQGQAVQARSSNLAFAAGQARSWSALPPDEALFQLVDGRLPAPAPGTLAAEAARPRFPLAGPEEAAALYLPLGMATTPDPALARSPLTDISPETRLERNGLAHFDAGLFLDPALARVGSGALLAEANHKYYLRGEALRGLHALLPLDEVTLVAVPDAAQPGWSRAQPPEPDILPPPTLQLARPPAENNRYRLAWTAVSAAEAYTLQEAAGPTFEQTVVRYRGPELQRAFLPAVNCSQTFAYRVRAERGTQPGPWSNTVMVVVPPPDFEACPAPDLEGPALSLTAPTSPPAEEIELTWPPLPEADAYRLETAADPAFLRASTLYHGPETIKSLASPRQGVHYYRVRAERAGRPGPWSNTEIFAAVSEAVWEMTAPPDYTPGALLAVHRALLRFCAARADMLAVLALPAHYHHAEALAYVRALRPEGDLPGPAQTGPGPIQVLPLTFGERRVLSFGALFHPWPATRLSTFGSETRFIPPDGPVAGTMAAQAATGGAWLAPANEPLQSIVALNSDIDRPTWRRLYAEQINIVHREPRGFLLLSAATLSPVTGLALINVRRLLILLRRLLLRRGSQFAFAPNSEDFREIARFKFEQLLTDLYNQGAFAGDDPAAAFQVVVDDSVNPPVSIDQGRFIVELRLAPARPLAFLTVRLVHRRNEGLLIEEV